MTSRTRVNGPLHLGALCCLLVAVMSLVPMLWGCSQVDKTRASIESNNTDPRWVIQHTPSSNVAVVFVHGIFGDTLGTWTHTNGKSFLQYLEEDPKVGSPLDMFAFGFTSNMVTAGSLDIQEAANKLYTSLVYNGVLDYPAVVFVAHSMGGLVVLQQLVTHQDLLERVRLIFLYATPQEGAQITTIAKEIIKNSALKQMLPADGNSFLRTLNDQWISLPARPHISCAYEKLATFGIMVVPWSSGTRFCDDPANAIADADHLDIVKPNRPTHDSLVVLVNALNTHALGKQLSATLETPDFVPEGDHVVFNLLEPYGYARLVNAGGAKLRFTLAEVSDSSLYLWPEDTPRDIPAKQTQKVKMALGFLAVASEYTFVLRTDVDLRVVVRVPNFAAMAAKKARLVEAINHDINNYLSVQANLSDLARLPPESTEASDEIVRVVHTTVATFNPEFPESARWVISADILAALNWPQLAAAALRRAESLSPSTAKSPGVRHLAGVIAAQSGEQRIFANAETPTLSEQQIPKRDLMKLMIDSNQFRASKQLATRLQAVPSLKMYGLSLEGDLLNAEGNPKTALIAYKESEAIRPSPSISRRVMSLAAANVESPPNSADTTKGGQNVGPQGLQGVASNQSGKEQRSIEKVTSVVKEKLVDWGLASPDQGRGGQPSAGQQGQGSQQASSQSRNPLQASFETGGGQGPQGQQSFGAGSPQGGQNVAQQGFTQGQQFQGQQGQSGQGSFQGGNYGQQPQGQSWQQGTSGASQQFQSGGTQGQGTAEVRDYPTSPQGGVTSTGPGLASSPTEAEEEHMNSVEYYQEVARRQYATLKQECDALRKDPTVYEQCQTYAKSVKDKITGMAEQKWDETQGSNQRGVDRRIHRAPYP